MGYEFFYLTFRVTWINQSCLHGPSDHSSLSLGTWERHVVSEITSRSILLKSNYRHIPIIVRPNSEKKIVEYLSTQPSVEVVGYLSTFGLQRLKSTSVQYLTYQLSGLKSKVSSVVEWHTWGLSDSRDTWSERNRRFTLLWRTNWSNETPNSFL